MTASTCAAISRTQPDKTTTAMIATLRGCHFVQAREGESRTLPQYLIDEINVEYDPPPRGPPGRVQGSLDFEQQYGDRDIHESVINPE